MLKRTFVRMLLAAGLVFSPAVHAQEYPSKLIKVILSISPGAVYDPVTRLIAGKLRDKWGQPVIVENHPGGSDMAWFCQ